MNIDNFLAIGLVVKGGKEFFDNWIKTIDKLECDIFVVDNGADDIIRDTLIKHPKVKRYLLQKDLERNMSRDYQKILEMAREEGCQWIWNLDIDEFLPELNMEVFFGHLVNSEFESLGFPLFEMRDDDKHYIMVEDFDGKIKDGRLVHKCFKILSHFKFDEKDKHGSPIPHNCPRNKSYVPIPICHCGHMTKELRDEKRKKIGERKDDDEFTQPWMEEDESKVIIKTWESFVERFKKSYPDIEKTK